MTEREFTFTGMPQVLWDFSISRKAKPRSPAKEAPSAPTPCNRALPAPSPQARRKLLARYRKLPLELKLTIWAEAMEKPGVHFFAVHVSEEGAVPGEASPDGSPRILLTDPRRKVEEFDTPYISYFPKGKRSAYFDWLKLARENRYAKKLLQQSMVSPLVVHTRGGAHARIDAATDLVYLKFHYSQPPSPGVVGGSGKKLLSRYMPFPVYWMLILDSSALRGIRHVALEFEVLTECVFWPMYEANACRACNGEQEDHCAEHIARFLGIADFLHCFPDLESVYAVFTKVKQGPVDRLRDEHYTVSGIADPNGLQDPRRWKASPAKEFHCRGGTLREVRGNHIVLSLARVVEVLQAYYIFHASTTMGDIEATSTRPKAERLSVKFKLAAWADRE